MVGHDLRSLVWPADVLVRIGLIVRKLGHQKHHGAHALDAQVSYTLGRQERKHAERWLGEWRMVKGSEYSAYLLRWESLTVEGLEGVLSFGFHHEMTLTMVLDTMIKLLNDRAPKMVG